MTAPAPTHLWTSADLCDHLRIGRSTLQAWLKAGKIPAPIRIGRRLLWDPAKIRALLAQQEG